MVSLSLYKHNVSEISNYCGNKSDKKFVVYFVTFISTFNICRPHRSSLAPQRLHKILFLKANELVFDASELL